VRAALHESIPDWLDDMSGGDLFSTGPWFRHFAKTAIGEGESAKFLEWRVGSHGAPIGLALKTARAITFPHPRLLESMVSYYSCGYGPIGSLVHDEAMLRGLGGALGIAAQAFDAVKLGPMDRNAAFAAACQQGLTRAGLRTFWTLAYRNWYAATEGMSYRQYLSALTSTFPATSEKRRQSFLRKHPSSISIVTSADGLDEAIDAYQHVYASSWKQQEPFPAFIPGLIRTAAEQGWLRLGILRVEGEAAAAQLWFVVDRRALIYKVAYVDRFAKLSVGSTLSCALLEHVLDIDHVREVDFLSGDDPYKAKWMFARRDRWTLLGFNPRRWRGVVAACREAVSQRRNAFKNKASPVLSAPSSETA
jgi:Acetyltransferase (GNAT) domain